MITESRKYRVKNPSVVAVSKWMENKLEEELAKASTQSEKELATFRYSPVSYNDLWVEYQLHNNNINNKFLTCFSIRKREFCILDAELELVSFLDVIKYFSIPVKTFANYDLLFRAIKNDNYRGLFKVTNSLTKSYGITIDNRLSLANRYENIITLLGDVEFLIDVIWSGETCSLSKPVVGNCILNWCGMKLESLEAIPVEEIK